MVSFSLCLSVCVCRAENRQLFCISAHRSGEFRGVCWLLLTTVHLNVDVHADVDVDVDVDGMELDSYPRCHRRLHARGIDLHVAVYIVTGDGTHSPQVVVIAASLDVLPGSCPSNVSFSTFRIVSCRIVLYRIVSCRIIRSGMTEAMSTSSRSPNVVVSIWCVDSGSRLTSCG